MTTDKQRIAAKKWWNDNRDDFVNGFTGFGLATRSEYDIPAMLAAYAAHSEQGWVSVSELVKAAEEAKAQLAFLLAVVKCGEDITIKVEQAILDEIAELDRCVEICKVLPAPPVHPESAQEVNNASK